MGPCNVDQQHNVPFSKSSPPVCLAHRHTGSDTAGWFVFVVGFNQRSKCLLHRGFRGPGFAISCHVTSPPHTLTLSHAPSICVVGKRCVDNDYANKAHHQQDRRLREHCPDPREWMETDTIAHNTPQRYLQPCSFSPSCRVVTSLVPLPCQQELPLHHHTIGFAPHTIPTQTQCWKNTRSPTFNSGKSNTNVCKHTGGGVVIQHRSRQIPLATH